MLVTGKLEKENHRNGKEGYKGCLHWDNLGFLSRKFQRAPRFISIHQGINRHTKYKIAKTSLKTFHRWPFSCRSSRSNSYSEFLTSIGTIISLYPPPFSFAVSKRRSSKSFAMLLKLMSRYTGDIYFLIFFLWSICALFVHLIRFEWIIRIFNSHESYIK